MLKTFFVCLALIFSHVIFAQARITNRNTIGWYALVASIKVKEKLGLHTEYQWRRYGIISNWQQGLLRVGVNWQAHSKLQLRAGYALAETYPYGEIPLNVFGKPFTEHRLFQTATLTDKLSKLDLSHRFMLEQRWVGRYSAANLLKEDGSVYSNRMRYMFRVQLPLKGKEISDKIPYLAFYDEVFIGFGKNVGENVFDQNRLGILMGYRFNKSIRLEGGYFNQVLQLGREINNRNVFQNNKGIIISTNLNLDWSR